MIIRFTPTVRTPNFLMNALHWRCMLTSEYELMALHTFNDKGETTGVSYPQCRSTFVRIDFPLLVLLLYTIVMLVFRDHAEKIVSACEGRIFRVVLALATTIIVLFVATATVTFPVLSVEYREMFGGWMVPSGLVGFIVAWFCLHAMTELGNALGILSEEWFD